MKRQHVIYLLLAIFFCVNNLAFSQKFYISPAGNDSNTGTIENPLATLIAARDMARQHRKNNPGLNQPVEIVALGGEYFMLQPLFLYPIDSGTENSPLIIKGETGKKVIFRGSIELKGFEKVNENLWKTFVPQVAYYDSYFEQLYVNGRRAIRARSPNEGFYFVKKVEETIIEKGEGRSPEVAVQKIIIDSTNSSGIEKFSEQDKEDALVVFYHNWDNTRKRILNYNKEQSAFYIAGEGMKPWNPVNNRSRWFVENYFAALDTPGEWFLDRSGYLYYMPLPGETPENSTAHAPVIKEFIKIEGESAGNRVTNIRFENVSFEFAGYRTPASGNEPAQAAAPVEAVITLDFAKDIEFRNCEVAHTGTYGFWFRRACTSCTVNHCYIHDIGAGGVKIGETIIRPAPEDLTSKITIDNNIIRDAGHIFPCAVGIIIFNASDNKLTHNEIADLRYSGISVGWVWGYANSPTKRNEIKYNHIHHLGWGELCDMGGVYTLGASEGTSVSNNLIHHIYSFDYGGWGLYTDEGSYGILLENNLVFACKSSGFHQHYGKENIIRNNIFAFNIRSQLQATRIEEHRSISFTNNILYFNKGTLLSSNWHKFNLLTDYNCYWDTRTSDIRFNEKSFGDWKKEGKDPHSIVADPLFADAEGFDFHFRKMTTAKRIKFVPFDYSQAGVYGSEEWKNLSIFDAGLEEKFNKIVELAEMRNKN